MRIEDRIYVIVKHLSRLILSEKIDEADEYLSTFKVERTQELVEGRWVTEYYTLTKNLDNNTVEINTDGRIYVKNIAGVEQIYVDGELRQALELIHEYLDESLP